MQDMKTVTFVARLSADCRRRHIHSHLKGKVVSFSVQLELKHKERWHPVVRYDTAHGFAHKDIINPDGSIDKSPLFLQDYNEALIFAEGDLKDNWESYRDHFLKEVSKND